MQCLRFGGQIAMSSPGISKIEFAADSPLEEDGFELAVPPRIGKGCRQPRQASIAVFGPELVSGSAFCAAVSDCDRPEEPFAGAGPKDAMGRAAEEMATSSLYFLDGVPRCPSQTT